MTYKIRHELTIRLPRRTEDILSRRERPAVRDVLPNGAAEEDGLLAHVADFAAELFRVHLRDVLAVDGDGACVRVVEAEQQARDRALAST